MPYATPDEVREYCGLAEEECPDEKADEALDYAKGLIDDYCNTTFEDPGEDSEYFYDGNWTYSLLAPTAGPFALVLLIEYREGSDWTEYSGEWWLKAGGEILKLDTPTCPGNHNWRVTGRCWTSLSEYKQSMLKRAGLGICKLYLIARDEPLGPSVSSMSAEGISYNYQPVNEGHPTGVNWIDYNLRSLRRSLVTT
ncbi:MAG: hypothetical protein SWK76_17020 [Actinomycetota bacterium]|nr:hypothetical protein [Actinomycetota bacterium]